MIARLAIAKLGKLNTTPTTSVDVALRVGSASDLGLKWVRSLWKRSFRH